MRILSALALSGLLALSACTTTPSGGASSSYDQEFAALERQCAARGGILRPQPRYTAQPSLDYVCIIRDGPSEHILDLKGIP